MRKYLLALLFYGLVVILVFGKALVPPAGQLIFGDDIHRQYYFYREFFNYFLNQGIFPWWNPYLFSGGPFIANPVVNIWYPPTWLFTILPLNLAYSWHLAFHIFLAMMGMYVLISNIKNQISKIQFDIGAWAGGLIFGLSGFFMARVWAGHVDLIAAAAWMPWVVGAFWRLIWGVEFGQTGPARRVSRGGHPQVIIASALFALQLYAGYQTMAFFTLEAVVIVTLLHCYLVKSLKPLLKVLLAGLLGLGLAGLQLIPEQEFFRSSIRTYAFPYSWNAYGAITLDSLKQLINPFYFGDQVTYTGPAPNYIEHAMFVGWVALGLAVLALLKLLKSLKKLKTGPDFAVAASATIAVFGLWLSLGTNAPFDLQKLLWQVLPMYHYLRIPSRHLILFVFGVSVLSGLGLEKLRQIKAIGLIGELLIVGLVILEFVPFARHFIALKDIPEMRHDKVLLDILKSDIEPYRTLSNFGVWVEPRNSFDFDSASSYRIFNATGYDPSILRSYYEYFARAVGQTGKEAVLTQDVQVPYLTAAAGDALNFLNIKYILVPAAYDPFANDGRYRLAREDALRGYRLYENTMVRPRFYLSDKSCGAVNISSYTPNRIILKTSSTCDGYLSTSEVWYPGWQAIIDGKKVSILRSNLAFRSLFVPKGDHTVVMVYTPTIFFMGLLVSGLAVGLSLIAAKKPLS